MSASTPPWSGQRDRCAERGGRSRVLGILCGAPQETSPNGEFAGEVSHLAVLVARLVELPVAFRSPAVDVSETVSVSSAPEPAKAPR